MKKIADGLHSATFEHPLGHQIVIAKKPLSAKMLNEINSLPLHRAKGGSLDSAPEMGPRSTTMSYDGPKLSENKSQEEPSRLVKPLATPKEIISSISSENNEHVGGTIRDGSKDEIFVVGNMIFQVEPAKKITKGMSNCNVSCQGEWSEKINVEEDHAIRSDSDNPVLIAQIPTEHGLMPLLFDGHHRMYKAISEGKPDVPGYLFTPEETLSVLSAPPDLMYKLRANLKAHHSGEQPQMFAKGGEVKIRKKMADGGEAADEDMAAAQQAGIPIATAPTPPDQSAPAQGGILITPDQLQQASKETSVSIPVQPEQATQAPPAQTEQTPQAAPNLSDLSGVSMESAYGLGVKGAKLEEQAAQQLGRSQAQAAQNEIANLQRGQQDFQSGLDEKNQEIANTIYDIQNNHIDPNHYLENQSTPQKISTFIGLVLGGIGGAITHQGNPALAFLNAQIDRDINAQKVNMDKQQTVLGAYFRQTGNLMAAADMARATNMGVYSAQLAEAAAKAQNPMAKARAAQTIGQLQQQMIPLIMRAQALEMGTPRAGGGSLQVDPSLLVTRLVPEQQQAKVNESIGEIKDLAKTSDEINRLFNIAASSPGKAIGIGPGAAAIKQMQALLLESTRDKLGRYNPEAASVINRLLPRTDDTSSTLRAKQIGITNLLSQRQIKLNAITTPFGINMDHFAATSMDPVARMDPAMQRIATEARQRLNVNPNDSWGQAALKKLGVAR